MAESLQPAAGSQQPVAGSERAAAGSSPNRRRTRVLENVARWSALAVAALVAVVFVLAQRQTIDVSYAQSPTTQQNSIPSPGSAEVTLPSVDEMTELVRDSTVVRLPGAIAFWNEDLVTEAIGDADIRILVAPPGLTSEQRSDLRAVEDATIRVIGTEVTGGGYGVVADSVETWRAEFATGDVTSLLITLIDALADAPERPDLDTLTRRTPTDAEIAVVATDLRTSGLHLAPGATLDHLPASAATAFPDAAPLVVALPRQPFGAPVPAYGPALRELFPDAPIVVLYGLWMEYDGPDGDDFASLVTATFYGQFGDLLNAAAYPQQNVLNAYLNRVTDVRYAGLFDRPLPYQPWDPLRVALPALPWVFLACVVFFVVLSVRTVRRQPAVGGPMLGSAAAGVPARLAGLTTLAIEMSGLTDARGNPSLARGIAALEHARSALVDRLPPRRILLLLDDAETELDAVARSIGRSDYRPARYLNGRLT